MAWRKGQYTVVEQVLLFGLGVIILSGFLLAFENFGRDVKQRSVDDQSRVLAELLRSHVVHLVQTDAEGRLRFEMPQKVAGEDYIINFTNSGIAIITTEGSYTLPGIYGLQQKYDLEGTLTNQYETGAIVKEDRTIRIEGS